MIVRTLRYNLNRDVVRKDLEVGNALWSYDFYNNYYSYFLLDRRFLYKNAHESLEIKGLSLSISNKNVLTANFDALISNFFFLRYFTGKKPFFLPVKIVSSFHERRYSYTCKVVLKNEEAFFFFSKYITHASNVLSLLDFNFKEQPLSKHSIYFLMGNFSYFRITGTHLAFLDWKANLELELIFNKINQLEELVDLLTLLKCNPTLLQQLLN